MELDAVPTDEKISRLNNFYCFRQNRCYQQDRLCFEVDPFYDSQSSLLGGFSRRFRRRAYR